jgi:hypothetical protein
MRWQLALVSSVFLVGCPPSPMGQPYVPDVLKDWNYVQYAGDKVHIGADVPDVTVGVKFKNEATGQTQVVPLPGGQGDVPLDATTLPGYDATAAAQGFELDLDVRWHGAGVGQNRPFLLVADREATLLPTAPMEYGTQAPKPRDPPEMSPVNWRSTDSDAGPEAYVQYVVATWPIPSPTISSAPAAREGLDADATHAMEWLPAGAQLVRYEIHAAFPKYVVPDAVSPKVLAPTTLELTLSRTDPSVLVSRKVY